MSLTDKEYLKHFAKAIAVPLYNTDAIKWPIRSSHVISVVKDIYATEYMEQLDFLVKNYDPGVWNCAIPNALTIWRVSHHIIDGLKMARIPNHLIAKYCVNMIDVIRIITGNDNLYSSGYRICSSNELQCLATKKERIVETTSIKKAINMSSLMWALSEAFYFQAREISCVYHGPYELDNEFVLIRDFSNLHPYDLWRTEELEHTFNSLRVVTFHKKDIRITIDAFNNVNISGGNFVDSCKGALFFVDGKGMSLDVLDGLLDAISESLTKQLCRVNQLSKDELLEVYCKLFWYRKKPLSDFLKMDWTPSEAVISRITNAHIEPSPVNNYKELGSIQNLEREYDYSLYYE